MKILLFFILSTAALVRGQNQLDENYGQLATPNQFKFAATIYYYFQRVCNGAIISEFYIITAAHCIENARADVFKVIVGSTLPCPNFRLVRNTYLHRGYHPDGYGNDIGFIELMESLVFNAKIQPIAYETQQSSAYYLNCTMVRFKGKDPTGSFWHQRVVITTYDECKELYDDLHINERCILTPFDPIRSPRPGDSGAPIVCDGKLTGILGTSMKTEMDMAATVVMVAPYQDWIGDRIY